ncbi:hypothetical protein ACFQU1_07075 [Chelatococcus sp. GCM10030263]|uniref:hypothetical protein n=1 Tax=Chelatococcus sp. GCM10030263 TaxID=3273387 RepID=UPI00360D9DF8
MALDSSYSKLDARTCRTVERTHVGRQVYGTTQLCRGRDGYFVLVNDEDDRQTVSFGRTAGEAQAEPAARQRFPAFTDVGRTIEWRRDGGSPFATIQRWSVRSEELSTSLLVVTRLSPGRVCHVAYVDARANPNANVLARRAADELAHGFACEREAPVVYGEMGPVLRGLLGRH